MKWRLIPLIAFSSAEGLRYISERKLESLGMTGGVPDGPKESSANTTSTSDQASSAPGNVPFDTAYVVLVKTQNCGEPCEIYEKSLDDMSADIGAALKSRSSNVASVRWLKSEVAQPGIQSFKKKFGLVKLPTVMLLRGPWVYEYSDDITSPLVSRFLADHLSGEIIRNLVTEEEVQRFSGRQPSSEKLAPDDVRIIIRTGEAGRQNFELIAGGEVEFAKYGYRPVDDVNETKGSMKIIKWADSEKEITLDFSDHKKVFEAIITHQLPSISEINMSKMRYYFYGQKAFAWIIDSTAAASSDEADAFSSSRTIWAPYIRKLRSIVRKHSSEFNFILINPKKSPHFKDFLEEVLKIEKDTDRALVLTDLGGPGRFTYHPDSGDFWNSTELKIWFDDVLSDKIERELQSEKIPEDETERMSPLGLKKLVADELSKVLIDSPKNHLIIVPSMLCAEEICEQAIETLKQFQANLTEPSEYSISLVDGHRNEFAPKWKFDLTTSPPLWLIKKGQKIQGGLENLKKIAVPKKVITGGVEGLTSWLAKDESEESETKGKNDEL